MAVTTDNTNKPILPRGADVRPIDSYNRAALYSGKALDFDGVNDVVNITTNDFDFGANDFSVSAIVDWSGTHTDGKLAYAERGSSGSAQAVWQIRTNGSGNILFQANTAANGWQEVSFSGVEAIIANTLTQLTFVRVGTGVTLYINGVFYSTGTGSIQATLDTPNGAFAIGNRIGANNYWDGLITQYKIFSGALTATQVADLYNNPEKIVPTGVPNTALKLWLPMQEGAGTTAYDGSGNGNHGTISGATYVHGIGAPVAQTAVIDWNKGGNLVTYSEQFDNTYWGDVAMNSVVVNDTIAPDGQNTADKITPNATTNIHYIYSTSNFLTGQNTISVFAKHNGYSIGFRPQGIGSNKSFVNFDLQNGVILSTGGTSYNDSSITSFGNGWYRCSMTMTNAGSYGVNFYAIEDDETTEVPNFTTDGTSGFYLWGAQVNAGTTLSPYVRTGATSQTSEVLLPQGLTTGRDITGVNLFENVRKQGALNLDGNSWAEVHDNASLDMTTGLSLEGWVYVDVSKDIRGALIAKYKFTQSARAYSLELDDLTLKFILSYNGTNTTSTQGSTTISTTGWYHFVGTYDGSNIKVYLNGAEDNTQAYSGGIYAQDYPVTIGVLDSDQQVTSIMDDQIAQPRIYNRGLTASEVLNNYNVTKDLYI